MDKRSLILLVFFGSVLLFQCGPTDSYDEYDYAVLAFVEYFNVPDSSSQQIVQLTLRGSFGESTAFHFDRINVVRTDSLFRVAAWGREVYRSGAQYPSQHVGLDTVLNLATPRKGLHYVDVVAAQGTLRDSTFVY